MKKATKRRNLQFVAFAFRMKWEELIAGWSDKVFGIIAAIDRGGDALDEIRKIELERSVNQP